MLRSIKLHNVNCYKGREQVLSDLNTINIIYGENGSGKSTIARLIENDSCVEFSSCCLDWNSSEPTKILIYNRSFIEETLRETKIKGVFTLGKKATEIAIEIESKKKERDEIITKLKKVSENIQEKENLKEQEESLFIDKCWAVKTKYDEDFHPAFIGFHNSKSKFSSKCKDFVNDGPIHDLNKLKQDAKIFFAKEPPTIKSIPTIDTAKLHLSEKEKIFSTKILGKEDIPIAKLIKSLENSDWVRQGLQYYKDSICPFCQQATSESLQNDLENYFDQSYQLQIKELKEKSEFYISEASTFIRFVQFIEATKLDLFKLDPIQPILKTIIAKYEKNKELISRKLKEPSSIIELDPIENEAVEITTRITKINKLIFDYNEKIHNLSSERTKLTDEIWKFIASELHATYQEYLKRLTPVTLALNGLRNKIQQLNASLSILNQDISNLERSIASITPSQEDINSILSAYGFANFRIEAHDDGYYSIKREDGSFAQESLSEGERTFISFLYFFQLIKGSFSTDDLDTKKVIVFDDPVSSLDSKVLFVISTLIRSLFCKKEMQKLNILQIFIFTHNVYFHKEVSYIPSIRSPQNTHLTEKYFSFWVLRKRARTSEIIFFKNNPIKTNYHLLWQEVRDQETPGKLTASLCNTLRRILENYFKILGGIDLNSLLDYFDGEEKTIVRSLTSWIHDGSHFTYDDIDIGVGLDLTDNYLPVFKKIFEKTEQIGHYDMMMKACE